MTCHNLKTDATGPALGGVLSRWNNDSAALKAFIVNAPKEIASKRTARAFEIYDKFKPAVMPAFLNFSNEELDALIAYMQDTGVKK